MTPPDSVTCPLDGLPIAVIPNAPPCGSSSLSKTLMLSIGRFAIHFGLLAGVYVWGEFGEDSLLTFYIVIATGGTGLFGVGAVVAEAE